MQHFYFYLHVKIVNYLQIIVKLLVSYVSLAEIQTEINSKGSHRDFNCTTIIAHQISSVVSSRMTKEEIKVKAQRGNYYFIKDKNRHNKKVEKKQVKESQRKEKQRRRMEKWQRRVKVNKNRKLAKKKKTVRKQSGRGRKEDGEGKVRRKEK